MRYIQMELGHILKIQRDSGRFTVRTPHKLIKVAQTISFDLQC